MSVLIKARKGNNGRSHLYLYVYEGGKALRISMGLYVYDEPSNPAEKAHNKNVYAIAEQAKAQKLMEPSGERISRTQSEMSLVAFIKQQLTGMHNDNTRTAFTSMMRHIPKEVRLSSLSTKWCQTWLDGLYTKVSVNAAADYFAKLKIILNAAVRLEMLDKNPCVGVVTKRKQDVEIVYLTEQELRTLAASHCPWPEVKRQFLFSCMTGLRFSDIQALTWDAVQDGHLRFRQQKTKGMEMLPLSESAKKLLGEPGKPSARIFDTIDKSNTRARLIAWAEASGISKHIHFHVGRHTYATMLLANGADLYTVSKLLGHKDIRTTQRYAKVIDHTKRKAVENLPDIL